MFSTIAACVILASLLALNNWFWYHDGRRKGERKVDAERDEQIAYWDNSASEWRKKFHGLLAANDELQGKFNDERNRFIEVLWKKQRSICDLQAVLAEAEKRIEYERERKRNSIVNLTKIFQSKFDDLTTYAQEYKSSLAEMEYAAGREYQRGFDEGVKSVKVVVPEPRHGILRAEAAGSAIDTNKPERGKLRATKMGLAVNPKRAAKKKSPAKRLKAASTMLAKFAER